MKNLANHKFYEGNIYHKRFHPRVHEFKYNFYLLDIDLNYFQNLKLLKKKLEKAIRNAKSRKKSIMKEEKIRKLNEGVQSAEKNVEKVKTYIETHFKEELTRESLASEVFMNPDYLSKLFKKNTGSSLMDYVTKVRIERAKELLERTVLTISEIAIETGYSNTAYFTKMFKKYTNGVTPREYRKGLGG